MVKTIMRWYRHTVRPLFMRQSMLAYDMSYWTSKTFKSEILKTILLIGCIVGGGVGATLVIVMNAQNAEWLAYVCVICISVLCVAGLLLPIHKLWLMVKMLYKKRGRRKVRH